MVVAVVALAFLAAVGFAFMGWRARRRNEPLSEWPAYAATVTAAVVGILALMGDPIDALVGEGPTTTAPTTTAATPTAPLTTAPSSVGMGAGTCLDDNNSATPCDVPHAAEVFAVSDECSQDELLRYLGGVPGQDVLRSDPAVRSLGGACVVSGFVGPLTRSNENVLLGRGGDVWRRCLDQRDVEVGCSTSHIAEVIFVQQDAAALLNCRQRADEYLGKPIEQESEHLRWGTRGASCLIEVRGDNVLTGSLRDLGRNALPLEAAPN